MTLVNASANINVAGIHRNTQCSWHCSRISSTSSVVRYSSHDGIAVLLTKSYRLRQCVVITACGNEEKAFCGSFHGNCRITMRSMASGHGVPTKAVNASSIQGGQCFWTWSMLQLKGSIEPLWKSFSKTNSLVKWVLQHCH